jgi:hypothetical protein
MNTPRIKNLRGVMARRKRNTVDKGEWSRDVRSEIEKRLRLIYRECIVRDRVRSILGIYGTS